MGQPGLRSTEGTWEGPAEESEARDSVFVSGWSAATETMNWHKGVVTEHIQHHEDYNVRGDDNPPWTRTVELEDGTTMTFNWGHLCRNRTGEDNTRVGMTVWVVKENGMVSAFERPKS